MTLSLSLVKIIAARHPVKDCQDLCTGIPEINGSELNALIDNICLTSRLHPWSLLIEAEEPDKFTVGSGVGLFLDIITDVFKAAEIVKTSGNEGIYSNNDCHEKRGFHTPNHLYNIPRRIMRVNNPNNTGIKAVLVVEHRNVSTQHMWLQKNLANIVLVMVRARHMNTFGALC